MIISIIQPCFVPWLGYFEQMAVADIFVYLDDVQYTKKDWRNNNQLKSPYGVKPIHVPVGNASRSTLIHEALISYNSKWEDDLINKITEWYKKAPFFEEIMGIIKPIVFGKYEKLVDLNYRLNSAICNYIGINTPISYASNIPKKATERNSRIVEICTHFTGVDLLYDGKSAQSFIDIELFKQNGITVIFQDYIQSSYRQLWGDFVPYMSVIDVMMNCGKESKNILMSSPLPEHIKKEL
ncbi:WbqC family protein [bacterium]|nr:MAG: WbqC family protein [bacterium]